MIHRLVLPAAVMLSAFGGAPAQAQRPSPRDCWSALTLAPLERLHPSGGAFWVSLQLGDRGWVGGASLGSEEASPRIRVQITCWPDPVTYIKRGTDVAGYLADTVMIPIATIGDASYATRTGSQGVESTTIHWASGGFLASVSSMDVPQARLEEVAAGIEALLQAPATGGPPISPTATACATRLITIPVENAALPRGFEWYSLRVQDEVWFGLIDEPARNGWATELGIDCGGLPEEVSAGTPVDGLGDDSRFLVSDMDSQGGVTTVLYWTRGDLVAHLNAYDASGPGGDPIDPVDLQALAFAVDAVLPG